MSSWDFLPLTGETEASGRSSWIMLAKDAGLPALYLDSLARFSGASFERMWLTTDPGTRAEALYRAAGSILRPGIEVATLARGRGDPALWLR